MPWKSATLGLVIAASLLVGCSSSPESDSSGPGVSAPVAESGSTRCDAAAAQFAVGQTASAALLAQTKSKAGAQDARFIGANDMLTLEYRSDRVNLNTDAAGKVVRVNCG
jgi:hypothetical protein